MALATNVSLLHTRNCNKYHVNISFFFSIRSTVSGARRTSLICSCVLSVSVFARIKILASTDWRGYSNRQKIWFCMPEDDISSIFPVRFSSLAQKLLEWDFYGFSYFFSNEQFHKFMKHCKFWSRDLSAMFSSLKWLLTFLSLFEHERMSL